MRMIITKPADPVIVGDYGGTDEHMLDADVHAIAAWTLAMERWRDSQNPTTTDDEGERVRLRVPALFFLDHANRACVEHSGEPDEYIISRNSRTVEVSLHPSDVGDLLKDAAYYDGFDGWDRADNRSACGSARSTIKALARQGIEQTTTEYEGL